MSVTRDRFCTVGASTTVRCPEFRDIRYSGTVNILFYRTFSWYMDYCSLLGICPLLGCPLMENLLYMYLLGCKERNKVLPKHKNKKGMW